MRPSPAGPNPRRVAAGRRNRQKRGPLTAAGRERLRAAALAGRPWEHATGPKTAAGKARSARNGASRPPDPGSARGARRQLAGEAALAAAMAALRRGLAG